MVVSVVPDLGEVGGLAHAVDAAEGDDEGLALGARLHHVPQDVNAPLGLQDLHQRVLQSLLYCRGHSCTNTHRHKHTRLRRAIYTHT